MEILNSGMEWLRSALQAHPILWVAGSFLAGVVSGILILKRSSKKKD